MQKTCWTNRRFAMKYFEISHNLTKLHEKKHFLNKYTFVSTAHLDIK